MPTDTALPSLADVRLHTPRLRLRPMHPDDAPALFAMHADAQFMRYWSGPPWTDLRQAQAQIEADAPALAAGIHLRLAIEAEAGFVGTCSLFHLHRASRRAELGYGIARPHWRRGYMREAVGALLAFAFGPLALNRVEADADPRNLASCRALEQLGFVREGLLRQRWIVGDEVSDTAFYGLLAADYKPLVTPA
ncbi:MAG: GNAT family N-acetyltransferase [Proteobacteria bacterium]|nr:GNAT family N-acetyltransferase [Pseudomonadota bacterium]